MVYSGYSCMNKGGRSRGRGPGGPCCWIKAIFQPNPVGTHHKQQQIPGSKQISFPCTPPWTAIPCLLWGMEDREGP